MSHHNHYDYYYYCHLISIGSKNVSRIFSTQTSGGRGRPLAEQDRQPLQGRKRKYRRTTA